MNELPKIQWYHIDRLIAEGGTAKVYWGIDLRSGFPVAIKELKVRHLNNPILRKKFIEVETQLYLYLQHPNIPKLVDFIDMKETGQLFLIMEFVEGKTLESYIYREIGLLPEEKALPIFKQILDTVAYLHNNNILHLDLKLNNVMLQSNGHIKLIDLGIASRMSDATSTGYGTPAYMAPEQFEIGGQCGIYTDVWSLGIMLFEILTGHLPFTSQNSNTKLAYEEIKWKIKYEPTPNMNKFYPFINPTLQSIVEKALLKFPGDRYQTCGTFASAIQDYIKHNNIN